jgi:hypothetical protein
MFCMHTVSQSSVEHSEFQPQGSVLILTLFILENVSARVIRIEWVLPCKVVSYIAKTNVVTIISSMHVYNIMHTQLYYHVNHRRMCRIRFRTVVVPSVCLSVCLSVPSKSAAYLVYTSKVKRFVQEFYSVICWQIAFLAFFVLPHPAARATPHHCTGKGRYLGRVRGGRQYPCIPAMLVLVYGADGFAVCCYIVNILL